jgi:hypothetical protein
MLGKATQKKQNQRKPHDEICFRKAGILTVQSYTNPTANEQRERQE